MRFAMVMIGFLALTATPALAQADAKIDYRDLVLKYWDQAMNGVASLEAKCERVTKDAVFKTEETYRGGVRYLKDGNQPLVSLYLANTANPKVFEHFVLGRDSFYEVAPASKEIRVRALPKAGAGDPQNLFAFLGIKADEAKRRYAIELADDKDSFKLSITPQNNRDRAEFSKAEFRLNRKSYIPSDIVFYQVNGNSVSWKLTDVKTPARLQPEQFGPPQIQGYQVVRVPPLTPGK